MKKVPREAENRAAMMLNVFLFTPLGLPPVKRQPIIGRTGPDITLNDFKLVVDVKSRIEVPMCIWVDHTMPRPIWSRINEKLAGVPLSKIGWLLRSPGVEIPVETKIVGDYYNHMDEWTKEECPDGITALILRRPGMKAVRTMFIIGLDQVELFRMRYYNAR